jgi:hypothetical protein
MSSTTNPCLLEQTHYDDALKLEQELLKKSRAARSKLENLKGTIDAGDFREITRALNVGAWPEQLLGPLDQSAPLFHLRTSASFVKYAKEAHLARQAYHDALDATAKANTMLAKCKAAPAYQKWRRHQSQTTPCGAPCTSRERKGQPCSRPLTAKRVCSSHGQRPLVASAAT